MNLRIAECYQIVRQEVATHWKTGVAITTVAIVVDHLYGKTVMLTVVLFSVTNYQFIGRKMGAIPWVSFRVMLIGLVMFGSNYYDVIHPKILCNIAVSLILLDGFQLASVIADLVAQNAILKENNIKLQKISTGLKDLEQELLKLRGPASRLRSAQEEHDKKIETLSPIIPEEVKTIPEQFDRVAVLFKELFDDKATQELMECQTELRKKISNMLEAFGEFYEQLKPLTQTVGGLSTSLTETTEELKTNVVLTGRQVQALKEVLGNLQKFK